MLPPSLGWSEHGGGKVFRNAGILPQRYTTSQSQKNFIG